MLAFASRIPLALWLAAGLAGAVWWGLHQRDGRIAAQEALRASERAQEALGEFLTAERDLNIRLTDSIGSLSDVADTMECVETPGGLLLPDLLRRQRDDS